MLSDEDLDLLLDRFDQSAARIRFADADAVVDHYMDPEHPIFPADAMGKRLRALLKGSDAKRFSTHEVREAVGARVIGAALGGSRAWADELHHLAGYFGGGTALLPPTEGAWGDAADLARALFTLKGHAITEEHFRWPRELATAEAAARLQREGVAVAMAGPKLVVPSAELEKATGLIQRRLDRLGFADVITNLLHLMRETGLCIDGLYIAGRRPDAMRTSPSTPWNLLLQLAVRSNAAGSLPRTDAGRGGEWAAAMRLATDLATVLEVEPHGFQAILERRPERMIPLLQEMALFDALFSFRQWPLGHTAFMLTAFYEGLDDAPLRQAAGWRIADAIALVRAVHRVSGEDPSSFTAPALVEAGAMGATLAPLLADMAHAVGAVNRDMVSPLAPSDLLFRPLLQIAPGRFTQIASSLAAPAFYEAVQARVRALLPEAAVAELSGNGTERVVSALFTRAGLIPCAKGAAYEMGGDDVGECDLVFEDDERILFVEAKAKPISRLAQTGVGHAALLDFAGGMLAAQLQGIGHERVLRQHGQIAFANAATLQLAGRRVYRLSVTLLDHAGLHDRLLVRSMLRMLLATEFDTVAGADAHTRKQVAKLNATLRKAAADLAALDEMGAGSEALHRGGSLSAGQLAIVLDDVLAAVPASPLCEFVERVAPLHTYGVYNPLSEYLIWRDSRTRMP